MVVKIAATRVKLASDATDALDAIRAEAQAFKALAKVREDPYQTIVKEVRFSLSLLYFLIPR